MSVEQLPLHKMPLLTPHEATHNRYPEKDF